MTANQSLDDREVVQERHPVREEAGREIAIDDIFESLSHPGRRLVLTYLLQRDSPVETAGIVEYTMDETEPPDALTVDQFRAKVRSHLLRTHLPMLADSGLLAWDEENGLLWRTPGTDLTRPYLWLANGQLNDLSG